MTRFSHSCSYVGKGGVARFCCKGDRDRIVKSDVFLFQDAADLRTSETRHYTNGVYSGTAYNFTWTDFDGNKVYVLNGSYVGEKKPPKPQSPYHFAQSTEMAWSLYLLDHLQEELDSAGMIRFNLGGDDFVGVGPGLLHLQLKGQAQSCRSAEIGELTIANGVFKVKRKDAKEGWFRSEGVFQFPYATMANAKLFLFAAQRLLGLPIS